MRSQPLSWKPNLWLGVFLLFPLVSQGATQHHRVAWDSDPSSNAVIGFSPDGVSNTPYVTYGYSTDESQWQVQGLSNTTTFAGSLTNHFVRLSGLNPDSAVYYRVCDQDGCGQRFWFKTAPTDNSPYIAVAGGDTRTGWNTRRAGNTLISKLRPLFIMHGGDFTDHNNASEMSQFLEDWSLTYSSDTIDGYSYKRIYPLIPTHGNHEDNNYSTLCEVFGVDYDQDGACSDDDTYGAFNVSPLLRVYTLNSQYKNSGWSSYATAMNNWLSGDLSSNGGLAVWRFAQYHKPFFPHYTGKSENQILFDWWASDFYNHAMNLVVESDTHMAKVTEALYPSGNGFAETTSGGTVYVGEGSWGAPARSADDPKSWTIDLASIQQFKVVSIFADKLEIRTALFDASASTLTREERAANTTLLPQNVNWWNANGIGQVMTLVQSAQNLSIIDTGSSGGGSFQTLEASDDTFISSTQSATNFDGSSEGLLADGSDSTYGEMMTLVAFDLSTLPDCSLVETATIELDVFNPSAGTYEIHSGVNLWDETSVTWNSVGGANQKDTLIASFNPSTIGLKSIVLGQAGIDVVNGWLQGTNAGVIISSGGTSDGIDMYSEEQASGPVLNVNYDPEGNCTPPIASFSFIAGGLTATFTDTSTGSDGTVVSWSWDFGDGSTSTDQNPVHIYSAPGTYTVTLTVSDDNGLSSTPDTVEIVFTDTDGDGITDDVDTDDDNDGMPDSYETDNGFDPLNAGDAGLDADGDGASNLSEFLAGTNPHDRTSVPAGTRNKTLFYFNVIQSAL